MIVVQPGKKHLLVSVYLSSEGLKFQRYKIDSLSPLDDSYFRIGRFLTSLHTLKEVCWDSVSIYFETDKAWQSIKSQIGQSIKEIFPDAKVYPFRLEYVNQWKTVSAGFSDNDVVFLQANDDHSFVATDSKALEEMIDVLIHSDEIKLGGVTHFPELIGLAARSRNKKFQMGFISIPVGYAVGTTLVKSSFFKSWWDEKYFGAKEQIVRPDNPLGRSVTFDLVPMIIPKVELVRHMDGYSHVGLYRPLAPLRNLIQFNPEYESPYLLIKDKTWKRDYWPAKIFGYSSTGADLHHVDFADGETRLHRIKVIVSRFQANWALRYAFFPLKTIRKDSSHSEFITGLVISTFTLPIIRNIPDVILDFPVRALLRLHSLYILKTPSSLEAEISYKGSLRTFTSKLFSKLGKN